MHYVGNDIVDLSAPSIIGKSKGFKFVNRILTEGERRLMQQATHPDHMLWVLWAAKESAFKALSKSRPGVVWAPKKYTVQITSVLNQFPFTGLVKYEGLEVLTTIYHYGDFLHAVGTTGPLKSNPHLIFDFQQIEPATLPDYDRSTDEISNYTRQLAINGIATHMACKQEDIRLRKSCPPGHRPYPTIRIKNHKGLLDISLSHDGRYAAYAFCAG